MKLPLLITVFMALLVQRPYAQERDTPEEGKPMSCDNYKATPAAHRCHCARDEQECHGGMPPAPAPVAMDKRCRTYCREQNCKCAGHGCTS